MPKMKKIVLQKRVAILSLINMIDVNQQPISVVGAGSWGTALAIQLASSGAPVRLWGHHSDVMSQMRAQRENTRYLKGCAFPDSLSVYTDMAECLAGVNDVLVVVPSHAFRAILRQLKSHVELSSVRIAWGTKGLDPLSQQFLHEVVAEELGDTVPSAIISGPSFAKEVASGVPTAVSVAGNDECFVDDLVTRFHAHTFRVYKNADFIGVQLCGLLKNILAIAVGMIDGLGLGANTRAALITRGLAEMSRLCLAVGGRVETLMGLAGVGDLVLTCTDNQSRNRRFGILLGEGLSIGAAKAQVGQEIEGYFNARQVYELSQRLQLEMPIADQVFAVLYEDRSPEQALQQLITRSPKAELE